MTLRIKPISQDVAGSVNERAREITSHGDSHSSHDNQAVFDAAAQSKYDAGIRELDHYAKRLPRWRYSIRQWLIPLIRAETPYLAYFQQKTRSSSLDTYFAVTANLGTLTSFMILLPILFWCGYTSLGRAMVHVLASGVFLSGCMKDLLCLPRPLSPPLQRITMSGSAALEYGFPSTHATNAVSVAIYAIYALRTSDNGLHPIMKTTLEAALSWYALSIVAGRLYCGMHGFLDVLVGSALGAGLGIIQCILGPTFDEWLHDASYAHPLMILIIVLILVRIHPEPADDCPCFDDSVAFAGVIIGVEVGTWHYGSIITSPDHHPRTPSNEFWSPKYALRILLGIIIIFSWRGVMKPFLLKFLPPLFRVIENLGLTLPRKFFTRASQYKKVPPLNKDDNVIPSASEIPSLLTSLRHPRKRTVSIGPQSAADVHESIAYSEKRRRESVSSGTGSHVRQSSHGSILDSNHDSSKTSALLAQQTFSSQIHMYEEMMGSTSENIDALQLRADAENESKSSLRGSAMENSQTNNQVTFARIERPRVRYDVEVVTKLIVYTGIAWLAVEGNLRLFKLLGLSLDQQAGELS